MACTSLIRKKLFDHKHNSYKPDGPRVVIRRRIWDFVCNDSNTVAIIVIYYFQFRNALRAPKNRAEISKNRKNYYGTEYIGTYPN